MKTKALFEESDDIWKRYKFKHIGEVNFDKTFITLQGNLYPSLKEFIFSPEPPFNSIL